MSTEKLVRITYGAGWVCAVGALLYKFLYAAGVAMSFGMQTKIFPYHVWQGAFLLFLISIATESWGRARHA